MRTIALPITVCGLVLAITGISVGSDFDALLQDLSFGDAPKIEQPETLNVTVDQAAEALKPAPDAFPFPAPTDIDATPLTALEEPVAVVEVEADSQPTVDFEEMFVSQDANASDAVLSTPLVELKPLVDSQLIGHRLHEGCTDQPECDSCNAYEEEITCYPHVKANLPYSSFRQYFRSNRCNTNVWDGYRQKCGSHHDCVTGNCDCFSKSRKSAGCTSCDACDR